MNGLTTYGTFISVILFSYSKKYTLIHIKTLIKFKCIMLSKKESDSKSYIVSDSTYKAFWKWHNHRDKKQNSQGFCLPGTEYGERG